MYIKHAGGKNSRDICEFYLHVKIMVTSRLVDSSFSTRNMCTRVFI